MRADLHSPCKDHRSGIPPLVPSLSCACQCAPETDPNCQLPASRNEGASMWPECNKSRSWRPTLSFPVFCNRVVSRVRRCVGGENEVPPVFKEGWLDVWSRGSNVLALLRQREGRISAVFAPLIVLFEGPGNGPLRPRWAASSRLTSSFHFPCARSFCHARLLPPSSP